MIYAIIQTASYLLYCADYNRSDIACHIITLLPCVTNMEVNDFSLMIYFPLSYAMLVKHFYHYLRIVKDILLST